MFNIKVDGKKFSDYEISTPLPQEEYILMAFEKTLNFLKTVNLPPHTTIDLYNTPEEKTFLSIYEEEIFVLTSIINAADGPSLTTAYPLDLSRTPLVARLYIADNAINIVKGVQAIM